MSTTDAESKTIHLPDDLEEDPATTAVEVPVAETTEADAPEDNASESQLDDLELQIAHREWTVTGDFPGTARDGSATNQHFDRTYTQKPLSYTAMLQFTGLIGEKISEAMSGEDGLTIDGVISEADGLITAGRNVIARQDFSGVDSFVRGLAKLAIYVPSVIEDCQCIWLRVPLSERAVVKEIWARSPEDGGLSIDDGEEMLEVFLAQNYTEVEDFFVVRLRRLVERVAKLRTKTAASNSDGSRRSKRSRHIQAPTQSD